MLNVADGFYRSWQAPEGTRLYLENDKMFKDKEKNSVSYSYPMTQELDIKRYPPKMLLEILKLDKQGFLKFGPMNTEVWARK